MFGYILCVKLMWVSGWWRTSKGTWLNHSLNVHLREQLLFILRYHPWLRASMSKGGMFFLSLSLLSLIVLVRPSEEEVTITRMLDKIIRRSDAIDKESLCILAGRRVSVSPSLSCSSHPHPPSIRYGRSA